MWRGPRHRMALTAAALGAAVVSASSLDAQRVDYSATVQSATGKYLFTERTTSLALFNGLSLDAGRLRLTATLPLLYQNSTAVTYVGGTPVPTGGPDAATVRRRQPGTRVPMGTGGKRGGMPDVLQRVSTAAEEEGDAVAAPGDYRLHVGDPTAELDLDIHRGVGLVRAFSVGVLTKAPVADVESGIGTGQWDYGASGMLALGADRTFVFANATWWLLGDMPDLPLRNTVSYGASIGRLLGAERRWSLLGSVTGATTVFAGADAPLSAGIGVGYLTPGGQGLNAGVSVGLSESSPAVSSYLGWRVPLGSRQQ